MSAPFAARLIAARKHYSLPHCWVWNPLSPFGRPAIRPSLHLCRMSSCGCNNTHVVMAYERPSRGQCGVQFTVVLSRDQGQVLRDSEHPRKSSLRFSPGLEPLDGLASEEEHVRRKGER